MTDDAVTQQILQQDENSGRTDSNNRRAAPDTSDDNEPPTQRQRTSTRKSVPATLFQGTGLEVFTIILEFMMSHPQPNESSSEPMDRLHFALTHRCTYFGSANLTVLFDGPLARYKIQKQATLQTKFGAALRNRLAMAEGDFDGEVIPRDIEVLKEYAEFKRNARYQRLLPPITANNNGTAPRQQANHPPRANQTATIRQEPARVPGTSTGQQRNSALMATANRLPGNMPAGNNSIIPTPQNAQPFSQSMGIGWPSSTNSHILPSIQRMASLDDTIRRLNNTLEQQSVQKSARPVNVVRSEIAQLRRKILQEKSDGNDEEVAILEEELRYTIEEHDRLRFLLNRQAGYTPTNNDNSMTNGGSAPTAPSET